jgi:hypothetical protein
MSRGGRRLTENMARQLTLSTEPWLSCEDCFRFVDAHVEAVLAGTPDRETPGMRVHLSGCAACAEEAESLLRFIAEQDGLDPAPALQRLRGDAT